jgi:hypothetical protein
MEFLELGVFLFQVPSSPSGANVDFVKKGVCFEETQLHLWHRDLRLKRDTLIVENWGSIQRIVQILYESLP